MGRPLSLILKDEAEKAKSRERKDFLLDCFLEADRLECVVRAQAKQIQALEDERARLLDSMRTAQAQLIDMSERLGVEIEGAVIRYTVGPRPILVDQPHD